MAERTRAPRDIGDGMPNPDKGKDKADKNSVQDALDALNNLPDAGNGKAHVPFPYDDGSRPFTVSKKTLRGAQHAKVPTEKLVATQPTIKRKRVERFIRQRGDFDNLPTIIKVNGKSIIADGHHRATADYLLGLKSVRCTFLDLGSTDE